MIFRRASEASRRASRVSSASRCGYVVTFAPFRAANRHPSTMDAWFKASEKISTAGGVSDDGDGAFFDPPGEPAGV